MDPNAPPLLEYLGEIPELMSAYNMETMHVVKDTILEIDCNWKIGVEPFIESYHLHITHPQALPVVDDVYEQFDAYKNGHGRLATPLAVPSPRTTNREMSDGLRFLLMEAGVDPAAFSGPITGIPKAIVDSKRQPDNRYALDYTGFTDSQIVDDWNYFIYPNMTFNTHPEGVLIMRFLPHPTNPEKHFYHVLVILPKLKEGSKAPFYFGVDDDVDISGETGRHANIPRWNGRIWAKFWNRIFPTWSRRSGGYGLAGCPTGCGSRSVRDGARCFTRRRICI
jgi:hypothetical protein